MAGGKGEWANGPVSRNSKYDGEVTRIALRAPDVRTLVATALDSGAVALAYQPIVGVGRNARTAYHEGLIRLFDPAGHVIPAKDFIGAVETSELGRVIDCKALDIGLKTLNEQQDIRLAINMSTRSIGYADWNRTLHRWLERDPTIGERLIIEITERSAMLSPELVISFMQDLQRHGICFALDDFGSGYTSFRYLRDFSFDIVKIDGAFIRDISATPDHQVLTRALVMIADHFDMLTIAERVETQRDADWLSECGIDYLQGYFLARPTLYPPWIDSTTGPPPPPG
ncbi:EAL domain-containing protein [Pseudooceanicola sediminis]|uniref:EAL domain-containing protein n=1 Tax=Pseudooceanicola sediminis TaxID=2211117 RepID=A0A399J2H8_9RHOB|nr:EAL domain-containing protein [Pseudooceanicola sediminis]KAA2314612.1 EAL domain-containing protein [Puniceibacterium sp. HSS470]RII39431.1 EAL domain-containing protein [Pseudooceanicola sediminis]|tara:strand:+ start:16950 stop:17804 length:855 start_codon:yes stop_codon:yes gene_type:complete